MTERSKTVVWELLLTVLVFTVCLTGSPAEAQRALIQPPGTGLFATEIATKDVYARFKGQTWISGTLIAEWTLSEAVPERTDDDGEEEVLVVRIRPSVSPTTALPYFEKYPVEDIIVENRDAALRLAVGAKKASLVKKKQIKVIRAEGRFLLSGYEVGVECDSPWARARIVKAKQTKSIGLAGQPEPFGC